MSEAVDTPGTDRGRPRTALVTGASAGIGEEYARRLAQRGYGLVLVARRGELLTALAEELGELYGVPVETIAVDLGTREGVDRVVRRLTADGTDDRAPIDLLVNNAGRGDGGPFVDQDPDEIDAMLDLNVRAVLHLTRAVLPVQIARRAADDKAKVGVITVSSLAGEPVVNPGGSVYGASKKFLTLWSESVSAEVRSSGVTVTVVLPGFVRTDMTLGVQERGLPEFAFVPKDHIVRDSLRAWAAGRPHVIPGPQYKTADGLLKVLPRTLVRVLARRMV
ncbi:SDR family NAD(P)-dependent oxidoreductase [Nocardiopsis lambiniae]|uniref:NADP-dependent 3-hydroxy acid dehydrogenase YdfG n=1 Tax=Nocardiopsis lambiniae TaxID=3075539 RepID=A0ABU2M764_9ACTN|nr:SDR family NAD(P)-dependent oxidoreductase [Nocardiopsis sp. DSM 44743]MDT0327980.1 SDR family NAD(P)-dependent oxidoreductase [Nocardiopsis sp. DSM 44743]